jgi:hypothetical protein
MTTATAATSGRSALVIVYSLLESIREFECLIKNRLYITASGYGAIVREDYRRRKELGQT